MAYVTNFADFCFASFGYGSLGVVWTLEKYALKVSEKTSQFVFIY